MSKNPKIKLHIKTEKQLNILQPCAKCGSFIKYRELFFYVDESNISITNNSKGICEDCKIKKH